MHPLGSTTFVASSECMSISFRQALSELKVRSQFDYACPTVGAVRISGIGVGNSAIVNPEAPALNDVEAKIRTPVRRARPEGRMIKSIQHLSLQAEPKPFSDRDVFCDRDVVVGVVRPIEPDTLSNYSRGRVLRDVLRIGAAARGTSQVLGIDERNAGRSGDTIGSDRTLQLRRRDSV